MKRSFTDVICLNKGLLFLYTLLFMVVFCLSILTPMVSDDFAYSFSFSDWTRIHSLVQILPSMKAHRITTNGRVLVHGLIQVLLLLPRSAFSFLNAVMFVLMLAVLRRLLLKPGKREELLILGFAFCFLFYFTPALGENLFWLVGSVNYMWSITISVLFLYPFIMAYIQPPSISGKSAFSVLHFILAFYMGTCSESASLVCIFLAICFLFLSFLKPRSFRPVLILPIVSAILGYVFLMSAPATHGRSGDIGNISAIGFSLRLVFQAANSYLLVSFLLFAVLLALSLFFHVEKKRIICACLLFIGGLAILLSYVFAAYLVPRHLFFTIVFTLFSICMLLSALASINRPVFSRLVFAGILVVFLLQFPIGVLDIAISNHKQQVREQQIAHALEAGESSVVLENYYPYSSYAVPFTLNTSISDVGPNINVSDYYGLESVLGYDPPEEYRFS